MGNHSIEATTWQTVFFEESTDYSRVLEVCETVYDRYWISPLHFADDVNNASHWHVVVQNDSKFAMLSDRSKYNLLAKQLGCNGYVEPTRKLYRSLAYLIHLNNPEKEQFAGGFKQVRTNARYVLDRIVKDSPSLDIYAWHCEHRPKSGRELCRMLACMPIFSIQDASLIMRWYANHTDAFGDALEPSEAAETVETVEWEQLAAMIEETS